MLEAFLFSEELVAVWAVSSKQSLVIRSQAAAARGVGHWGTQSESEEHNLDVLYLPGRELEDKHNSNEAITETS